MLIVQTPTTMVDAPTKELHAQTPHRRVHQGGNKKRTHIGEYPMMIQAETIQPQERTRSSTPGRKPISNEQQRISARQLVKAGVAQHMDGNYDEAIKSFQAALKAQILHYGADHLMVAHTYANIGAVYLKQGQLDLAGEALHKSLETKEQLRALCDDENARRKISVADVLNNLGNLAYRQGNFMQSMQFYRQNLRELRGREAPADKDLANALHNMGRLHVIRKEWDAASSILTQCQKVEEELFGPKSLQLADTLELIGYVHLSNRCYDNAMIAFSEALSIHQRHLGAVHENVATALINVAMVMEGQGSLKNACHTYATARDVFRKLGVPEDNRSLQVASRSYESLKWRIRNDKSKSENKGESAEERESLDQHVSRGQYASEKRD